METIGTWFWVALMALGFGVADIDTNSLVTDESTGTATVVVKKGGDSDTSTIDVDYATKTVVVRKVIAPPGDPDTTPIIVD